MIEKVRKYVKNEKEIIRFFFALLTPLLLSMSIFFWIEKSDFPVKRFINNGNDLTSFVGLMATIVLATSVSFTALSREINKKWTNKEIDLFLSVEFFVNFTCASVISFVVIEQFLVAKIVESIIVLFPTMLLYFFLCTQMAKGLIVHEIGVSQYEDKNYDQSPGFFKAILASCSILYGLLFPACWVLWSRNFNDNFFISLLLLVLYFIIPLFVFWILFVWFFSLVKSTFEAKEGELKYVTTLNGFPRFVAILLGCVFVGSSFYLSMSLFSKNPMGNNEILSIVLYSLFIVSGFFGMGPFSAMKILLDEIEDDFNSAYRDFNSSISNLLRNLKRIFPSIRIQDNPKMEINSNGGSMSEVQGGDSDDKQEINNNEGVVFFIGSEDFNSNDFEPSLIKYLNSIPDKLNSFEFRQQNATKHFFSMFYKGSRVGHLRLRKQKGDAEFRIGANYEHQNEEIRSELKDDLQPELKFETAFTDNSGAKREQFRIEFDSENNAPSIEALEKIFKLIKKFKG